MGEWRNWSGSVRALPTKIVRPTTEAELAGVVASARKVRAVGAGHSFMPLCATEGVLVSLDALEGEIDIDAAANQVWAPAGASLKNLTQALWERGYSLINQGDVNPQSLAGAISTGTHGTGADLGSLSTAAQAFRLVLADGSIVTCSAEERPDLFQAQRLSLGLLGVATRIKIDVLPAYHLEERLEAMRLDEVFERWDELVAANRHVEFFVFPYGAYALLKRLNPAPPEGALKVMNDMDDSAFQRVCDVCAMFPGLTPLLQKFLIGPKIRARRVGPAYQIFPSDRNVRFEEMEYEFPRANGVPALKAVIAHIRKGRLPVAFPFEFRVTAADDIWLSPFNAGPGGSGGGASISMHQYAKMPWRDAFAEGERIFRDHAGRPHWAKRHTLNAADVAALYPMADRFRAVRDAVDPGAKFTNAHLAALFPHAAMAQAA